VYGPPRTIRRLQTGQASQRPELSTAFAAGGNDAAVRLALVPSAGARNFVESLSADLPEELGGGPITPITRGLQWAVLSVQAPPHAGAKLIVQAKDAENAKALNNILDKAFAYARQEAKG